MITKKDFLNRGAVITEQKNSGSDYAEMISLLLHSRTQSHVLHLQTESYPEHMALNGYYDGIVDIIDGLVESYQGKYGIIKGYKSYEFKDYKNADQLIKYFTDLGDMISKKRDCCKDSFLQNQIDTVEELIYSTLYKLRNLK